MLHKVNIQSYNSNASSTLDRIVTPSMEEIIVTPVVQTPKPWLRYGELLLILVILISAGLAQGIGMFSTPSYLGDEGIYMSQAWAVVKLHQLAPYTYDYGHAPLGWIQIAVWLILVGGVHAFGTPIDTGRVLMLIFQIGSTYLTYRIARTISQNVVVATSACLLFALSPYAIYLHRRVLLDNIITFWMLLSVVLLLSRRFSLSTVWLSAVAFSIAILSKENALFLAPVLGYLVFYRADKSHRLFAVIGWSAIVGSLCSMYVLMAILKGELFPSGTFLGGSSDHVSLLGSAGWQVGREKDGGLFDLGSKFWQNALLWIHAAPFVVAAGVLFAIISLFLLKKHRVVGLMGLATFSLILFLLRGSQVLEFYLAPELPFMALNIALVLGITVNSSKRFLQNFDGFNTPAFIIPILERLLPRIRKNDRSTARISIAAKPFFARPPVVKFLIISIQVVLLGICSMGILLEYSRPVLGLQKDHLLLWQSAGPTTIQNDAIGWTTTQNDAVGWIQTHVPQCSSLIIDPSMWTDLHDLSSGGASYQYAQSYWQADLDPAIQSGFFHNDWRNVDYVIATPGLIHDASSYDLTLVNTAIKNATLIASFDQPPWQIDVFQVRKGVIKPGFGCKPL